MNFRVAEKRDIDPIFVVRTSVNENKLSYQQLSQLGITSASIWEILKNSCKAWVAEENQEIVEFSMADKTNRRIYALFVLPEWENKKIGKRLLFFAENWLWNNGFNEIWLSTESNSTRASGFYRHMGWRFKEKHYDDEDILIKCNPNLRRILLRII